jgi:hypothetical protein
MPQAPNLPDSTSPSLSDFSSLPQTQGFGNLPLLVQQLAPLGPVGGCLSNHLQAWKDIGADDWSLNVLENGYAPTFVDSRPPLTRRWFAHESATNPSKAEMLQSSVDEMLQKNAVELVNNTSSLGFYSHVFLVIKKTGKFRPVINLRVLNQTLEVPTFKMETVASIAAAASPGDWAVSLDLTDGYFHVPIAKWFRKYLRFVINQKVYQFRALPFGLATAPRIFTKILAPMAKYLHSLGIPLHRFIDDLLIKALSQEQLLQWAIVVIKLLVALGYHINLPKSMLDPTQDYIYIGVRFLTAQGLMKPPDDRISKILECIQKIKSLDPAPARIWMSLLGLLGSAEKQVPLGRLHIRPLQTCLHSQFRWGVHPLDFPVALNSKCFIALEWWSDLENLSKGQPLGPFQPDHTLFTDASLTSWGAHVDELQFSGQWTWIESKMSINQLELLAVIRALQALPPSWRGSKLMIASDNSSTIAYINKFGGTRSQPMLELTLQLYLLAQSLSLTLRARHIPGRLNRLADSLSRRHQVVNTEWILMMPVCRLVLDLWGSPTLDLMAMSQTTRQTTRLPVYVSPFPDPKALAVDAMSFEWTNLDAYIFPPWPMIALVLQKLKLEPCEVTAIIPFWPNRPWFPDLLELLVQQPRVLPVRQDLLAMPHNRLQHGNVKALALLACRLSSKPRLTKVFRNQCRNASPVDDTSQLHRTFTTPSGSNSPIGVVQGKLIQAMPLYDSWQTSSFISSTSRD